MSWSVLMPGHLQPSWWHRLVAVYGSGHEGAAVLLPGFAINWQQNQATRQLHFHDLTHISTPPWLTHWHLRYIVVILKVQISNSIYRIVAKALSVKFFRGKCHRSSNNKKSTLVQVMAWCHQATGHYLNQWWPRSMSSYGFTKQHWVNWSDAYNIRQRDCSRWPGAYNETTMLKSAAHWRGRGAGGPALRDPHAGNRSHWCESWCGIPRTFLWQFHTFSECLQGQKEQGTFDFLKIKISHQIPRIKSHASNTLAPC